MQMFLIVLQRVAVRCSVLLRVAVRCSVFAETCLSHHMDAADGSECVAACCSVLQRVAVCLQRHVSHIIWMLQMFPGALAV